MKKITKENTWDLIALYYFSLVFEHYNDARKYFREIKRRLIRDLKAEKKAVCTVKKN
jgi:hypothetical protein